MEHKDFSQLLYKAVMTLQTPEEGQAFFEDICTPKEIRSLAQRFAVAKMLTEGAVYNEIVQETGASTATVSRVSRTHSEGCKTAIDRMKG